MDPWQAFDSEEPVWERKSSGAELGSTWIGRWDRPLGIQELKIPYCGWAMGSTHWLVTGDISSKSQ